jgi:hypothetical protein
MENFLERKDIKQVPVSLFITTYGRSCYRDTIIHFDHIPVRHSQLLQLGMASGLSTYQ